MAGYLLNWKRKPKGGFPWEKLMENIEATRKGDSVQETWFVNKQQSIREGDRIFVIAQGGGALVLVAGPNFMPQAYRDTPLARLMPFDPASSICDWITAGLPES